MKKNFSLHQLHTKRSYKNFVFNQKLQASKGSTESKSVEEQDIVEVLDDGFIDRMLQGNDQRVKNHGAINEHKDSDELIEARSVEDKYSITAPDPRTSTRIIVFCILLGLFVLTGGSILIAIAYPSGINSEYKIDSPQTSGGNGGFYYLDIMTPAFANPLWGLTTKKDYFKSTPIYLDLPGHFSGIVPRALSNCLNMSSSHLRDSAESNKDFYYTDSFCEVQGSTSRNNSMIKNEMARSFILLMEPISNAILSYDEFTKQQQKKKHWNANQLLTLDRYLNIHFKSNILTRSLICKFDGVLTYKDFLKAKYVLFKNTDFGLLTEYAPSISSFQEKFQWNNKRSQNVQKCLRKRILRPYSYEFSNRQTASLKLKNSQMINILLRYDLKLFSLARASLNSLPQNSDQTKI